MFKWYQLARLGEGNNETLVFIRTRLLLQFYMELTIGVKEMYLSH